jgi:chaperonin GroEL (HSP60 family)
VVTDLRARHASEEDGCQFWGIDGTSGVIADMREVGVYETLNVKK